MDNPSCETCRFWYRPREEDTCVGPCEVKDSGDRYAAVRDAEEYVPAGECHRHAPPAVSFGLIQGCKAIWPEDVAVCWPVTTPLDWCGEWEGKK